MEKKATIKIKLIVTKIKQNNTNLFRNFQRYFLYLPKIIQFMFLCKNISELQMLIGCNNLAGDRMII